MSSIPITQTQIFSTLNALAVQLSQKVDSKGWIDVICPFHADKSFGSTGVNLNTSIFHCFACGKTTNLIGMVKEMKGLDYKDALDFIGVDHNIQYRASLRKQKKQPLKEVAKPPQTSSSVSVDDILSNMVLVPLDPRNQLYTRLRGYTNRYCRENSINLCTSDSGYNNKYQDYMITPIVNKQPSVNSFEARKIREYDYLKVFFRTSKRTYASLKSAFKEFITEQNLKYRKGVVYQDGEEMPFEQILYYLMKPKVLYPSNSNIGDLVWNLDNLDREADLYICEGLAGIPKIELNISKNVTAVFGASIKSQIKLLNQFKKRKIILTDDDDASVEMIKKANGHIEGLYVIPTTVDDAEPNYVSHVKSLEIMIAPKFLNRKKGLFDFGKPILSKYD